MHAPLGVARRHFLVHDAAAGSHPLDVARAKLAAIAEAVAVFDGAREHIGDRLDAAMGMPGKAGAIVSRVVAAEIVHHQERIEVGGVAETKGAAQAHAGALHGGTAEVDAFDRSNGHGTLRCKQEGRAAKY